MSCDHATGLQHRQHSQTQSLKNKKKERNDYVISEHCVCQAPGPGLLEPGLGSCTGRLGVMGVSARAASQPPEDTGSSAWCRGMNRDLVTSVVVTVSIISFLNSPK